MSNLYTILWRLLFIGRVSNSAQSFMGKYLWEMPSAVCPLYCIPPLLFLSLSHTHPPPHTHPNSLLFQLPFTGGYYYSTKDCSECCSPVIDIQSLSFLTSFKNVGRTLMDQVSGPTSHFSGQFVIWESWPQNIEVKAFSWCCILQLVFRDWLPLSFPLS